MSTTRTEIKVGTLEVQGKPFEIYCTERLNFRVTVGEVEVIADGEEKLRAKIAAELGRQKIEHKIDVVIEHETRVTRATLRGQNIRTHAYLFTLADGTKVAKDHPTLLATGKEMTDEHIAELNRLGEAARGAQKAERDYLRSISPWRADFSAGRLIEEAERAAGIKD